MLNVIAFSLWGDDPKYTVGAIKNARLALDVYPDWQCWFYMPTVDQPNDVPNLVQQELLSIPNVKIIHVDEPGDWRGMFWRFRPAADPLVDAFISRDCDSRLTRREAIAVDNWLRGPSLIHVMRDHPYHNTAILGGMWGAKRGALPDIAKLMVAWDQEDRWQTDQEFLANIIYPRCRSMIQEHDEFFANKAFPTKRVGYEFVGQIFDENDNTVQEHLNVLRNHIDQS